MKNDRVFSRLMIAVLLCVLLIAHAAVAEEGRKPLEGRTISVLGDSISTYMGWSDSCPITDPSCTNRIGEPYYGPVGSDCHSTDLLVTDTWWHKAATQLGAEILMSNAGNSTGLLHASYPANAGWDLYLKEMLAYKTRPYYLGADGKAPDIIALYIGSNDVAKCKVSEFGSVGAVNFDQLIQKNRNGYTYAQPATVAEAYCILLHKISVTYPNAEVYCFTVVPNAGGKMANVTQRLAPCHPFNAMVRGVAAHYGAHVVELLEEFQLDPDCDGVITEEALASFQACYRNDPHPNPSGFDVIARAFVKAVKENSRYIVQVETTAGHQEYIDTTATASGNLILRKADNYVTENRMTVNYASTAQMAGGKEVAFADQYTSESEDGLYHAQGGSERTTQTIAPSLTIDVPVSVGASATASSTVPQRLVTGDPKTSWDDGIYDFTVSQVKPGSGASAATTGITVTDNASQQAYTSMKALVSNTFGTETNGMVVTSNRVQRPTGPADAPEVPAGYDYKYIGSDQFSRYYPAFAYTQPQPGMPDEEPAFSGSGINTYVATNHATFRRKNYNLIIPRLYLKSGTVEEESIARWASLQQYTLTDRSGNLVTAYCADQLTNTVDGFGYNAYNVEDADYYTAEDAKQIRTIVNNGFWGMEEGAGSLSAVKNMMRQSGKFTEEEISMLNEGIAMTATQHAIWFSSNRAKNTIYLNCYYTEKANFKYPAKAADKAATDLIFKLCFYLTDLAPTEAPIKNTTNTIINERNFLDSVSVKVTGKPQNEAANLDSDDTNDVYTVDLTFQLSVEAVENNGDGLVMKLVEEDGDVVATGRIIGTLQSGETKLTSEGNGRYTFTGLKLQEGMESLRFMMTGSQTLSRGVYLYLSQVVDGESSQPLVSLAEGTHSVDVNMELTFDLNVSDDTRTVEHYWRTEDKYPEHLPATGDDAQVLLWAVLCLLSLAGLSLTMRKTAKK